MYVTIIYYNIESQLLPPVLIYVDLFTLSTFSFSFEDCDWYHLQWVSVLSYVLTGQNLYAVLLTDLGLKKGTPIFSKCFW